MKKIFLFVLLLFSTFGFSQVLTDGTYSIYLMDRDDNSKKTSYSFTIKNGKTDLNSAAPIEVIKSYGDTTEIFWLNKSEAWTESQTYIFTKDKKRTDYFYVHHIRVVQNVGEEPWSTSALGVVTKDQ